jgi:hypothetical protein
LEQSSTTQKTALCFAPGYPQPATPIQTDNICASGIANDTVKQRRSKVIDMCFYWVKDRIKKGQFMVYWRKGSENDADFFTKHHSPSQHRLMRSRFLHVESPDTPPVSGECVLMSTEQAGIYSAGQPRTSSDPPTRVTPSDVVRMHAHLGS